MEKYSIHAHVQCITYICAHRSLKSKNNTVMKNFAVSARARTQLVYKYQKIGLTNFSRVKMHTRNFFKQLILKNSRDFN